MSAPGFEQIVVEPLRRAAAQARRVALVEGACRCVVIGVALATAQYTLDRLLRLEFGPRAALLAGVAGTWLVQLWRQVVAPWRARIGVEAMAALLERRDPTLGDGLLGAVQLAAAPGDPRFNSPVLVAEVVRGAAQRFDAAAAARLVRTDRLRMRWLAAVVALIVPVVATALDPAGTLAFLRRNVLLRDAAWPSHTRLELVGFNGDTLRWPRGDELNLVVRAHGEEPARGLRVEYETDAGERGERALAARGPREFRLAFGPLDGSLKLVFRIGRFGVDDRSDFYRVEAIERPAVRALAVTVAPPAYARQSPFRWPEGQLSGEVLTGSSVELLAEVNKPIVGATLAGATGAVERITETRWQARFTPTRSGSVWFELRDTDGLEDTRPVTCMVRLTNDRPPRARLQLPGAGDLVTAQAILPVQAEFEDVLGIESADARMLVSRAARTTTSRPTSAPAATAEEHVLKPQRFEPGQPRLRLERLWPLAPLKLAPEDRLSLVATARDFSPVMNSTESGLPPSNEGRSAALALRVVSPEELLAELARRESAWRQEFEQTLKAQEALRDALKDAPPADAGRHWRDLARRQRQIAARVKMVRKQFQDILTELLINQLVTPEVQQRLGGGVIAPLSRLADTTVVDAATGLERMEADPSPAAIDERRGEAEAILASMRAILANMLRWEGYNEAVGLMRDVLRLQSDVNRETQAEIERRLDALFGEPSTRPAESEPPG